MCLAVFGVLWCFLCLLVCDASCFECSFGALEAHMTIFEFRNSNLVPNGSFVTVGNAVLDVWSDIKGFSCFWLCLGCCGVFSCACLCMIQVVLSIVSVHWRHIRPFLKFEIQIWSPTALL